MRKILYPFIILLIVTNLFGCKREENQEVMKYDFEYKFNEEYADKIDIQLALSFIGTIRSIAEVYDLAFDNFEVTISEEVASQYVGNVFMEYVEKEETLNEYEKELFETILQLNFNLGHLTLMKLEYQNDEINNSVGIKPSNTQEYYDEGLAEYKKIIENRLEDAKKFIY